jgi:hypothetical protein
MGETCNTHNATTLPFDTTQHELLTASLNKLERDVTLSSGALDANVWDCPLLARKRIILHELQLKRTATSTTIENPRRLGGTFSLNVQ